MSRWEPVGLGRITDGTAHRCEKLDPCVRLVALHPQQHIRIQYIFVLEALVLISFTSPPFIFPSSAVSFGEALS